MVLFAAGTSDYVNVSDLTIRQFGRVETEREMLPLLAYHPERVASESICRFQDEVGQDDAVIPAPPGSHRPLLAALAERGVALTC